MVIRLLDHAKDAVWSADYLCFRVLDIDEHRYMIKTQPAEPHETPDSQQPVVPATVINVGSEPVITGEWIKRIVDELRQIDDVFEDVFLSRIIFISQNDGDIVIKEAARKYLADLGNTDIVTRLDKASVEAGPHVLLGDRLVKVYKLYDDTHGAFLHTVHQDGERNFSELQFEGHSLRTKAVAVPSRPLMSQLDDKSLRGMRIAVKDIFQIKGVRTSVCNRAYYELYPPSNETAACIDILTEAGAVVVGTTKLASFAATEEPVECVDYQAPWNPRADGYQSPAGSSSGSGAALAAYPWLDITIGSDTSGSGRRPGHWNGCIAMRPTHGALPYDGYIASFRRFDVPTFFGRNLIKSRHFADIWYGNRLGAPVSTGTPAIIYPTDYMSSITNQTQIQEIDAFAQHLEQSLGVKCDKISFERLWLSTSPDDAHGASLDEYMDGACRNSFFYEDYHNFSQFRQDYQQQFDRQPYISPPVRWQWCINPISVNQHRVAIQKLETYREWFVKNVMRQNERDTIVLIPIENISPRYRDDPPLPHFDPVGVPNLFLSPITRGPELTIPIGTFPFESKVTGKTERLPIGISLLASPGRDLELFDIANECLRQSNRPVEVKTGAELF